MPRAAKVPFESKRAFLEHNRAFFSRKGSYGPENGLDKAKTDLFSALKNLFRKGRVYLEPKGTFRDEKIPLGAKKEAVWS